MNKLKAYSCITKMVLTSSAVLPHPATDTLFEISYAPSNLSARAAKNTILDFASFEEKHPAPSERKWTCFTPYIGSTLV